MPLEPERIEALDRVLAKRAGTDAIGSVDQLTGGASRQTFAVAASHPDLGEIDFVMQWEIAPEPRLAGGMADEADLVKAARLAGVPTPVVVATNRDDGELGHSFFITETVPGETIARRILRDDRFSSARAALPAQLGAALAALHTNVNPGDVPWLEVTDELARYREVADELDLVSPAFELGFRWLEANRPPPPETPRVVHGDFRLGNLIVDEAGLAAVIDWELGHLGDPMEDLGWVCVRAWRFGGAAPVAGVGEYEDFYRAYEAEAGVPINRAAAKWWEALGTLKWGVMCGSQGNRHLSGDVPSVELVSIGPRVAEQEYDILQLIHPGGPTGLADIQRNDVTGEPALATGMAEGGGRPSAAHLLDAVRGYLLGDVSEATDGRTRFHALVAANALSTVERELELIDGIAERQRARLAALGYRSERELAAAIRGGDLDDRSTEVTEAVQASIIDRLSVNNPKWLPQAD